MMALYCNVYRSLTCAKLVDNYAQAGDRFFVERIICHWERQEPVDNAKNLTVGFAV